MNLTFTFANLKDKLSKFKFINIFQSFIKLLLNLLEMLVPGNLYVDYVILSGQNLSVLI